jgi:hypothetical protein
MKKIIFIIIIIISSCQKEDKNPNTIIGKWASKQTPYIWEIDIQKDFMTTKSGLKHTTVNITDSVYYFRFSHNDPWEITEWKYYIKGDTLFLGDGQQYYLRFKE